MKFLPSSFRTPPTGPRKARPDDRLRGDPESSSTQGTCCWIPGSRASLAPRNDKSRRAFLSLLGSAAAGWPLAARAQQGKLPTVGFLRDATLKGSEYLVGAFHRGLMEVGFLEGQNVIIELGMSEGQRERLTAMAAEFARRPVSLIAASATSATVAAKAATSTVPIVFAFPGDPIQHGLVTSMNRPGGNATGVSYLNTGLAGKRIGILRDLFPNLANLAVLINPNGPNAEETVREVSQAAAAIPLRTHFLRATAPDEIDKAFDTLRGLTADALLIGNDTVFTTQRIRIVENAARIGIVAVYAQREFAQGGGLMSYGASLPDAYRLAGTYAGRILKGERPADLPVLQPTKFELVVNLKAAKALGLQISDRLLALADEVIE